MLALAIESVENRWFSRGFRAYSSFLVQCYSEASLNSRLDGFLMTRPPFGRGGLGGVSAGKLSTILQPGQANRYGMASIFGDGWQKS
jgi:hypothetical protein